MFFTLKAFMPFADKGAFHPQKRENGIGVLLPVIPECFRGAFHPGQCVIIKRRNRKSNSGKTQFSLQLEKIILTKTHSPSTMNMRIAHGRDNICSFRYRSYSTIPNPSIPHMKFTVKETTILPDRSVETWCFNLCLRIHELSKIKMGSQVNNPPHEFYLMHIFLYL